jgi:hypothetical protein
MMQASDRRDQENGRIASAIVRAPQGETRIRSELVVGCDGRPPFPRAGRAGSAGYQRTDGRTVVQDVAPAQRPRDP